MNKLVQGYQILTMDDMSRRGGNRPKAEIGSMSIDTKTSITHLSTKKRYKWRKTYVTDFY